MKSHADKQKSGPTQCSLAGVVGAIVALVLFATTYTASAGDVTQHFPAQDPASQARTQWRVVWGIEHHGGGSEILYIKEAFFKRSHTESEIKVLDDCRLAEIFVPYNSGFEIFDISDYSFPLIDLRSAALGPACIEPGEIYNRLGRPADVGPVAVEIHDDDVRWIDQANKSRRGQVLVLWSVLSAGNYRYIMQYRFRDDGVVGFRLGATASNLNSHGDDSATHLHTGWWRLHPALGDPANLRVEKVHLDTTNRQTVIAAVGTESKMRWEADQFTRLRVVSEALQNAHDPPHPIVFEIFPHAVGTGRYDEESLIFTKHEFWVTRARGGEFRPRDLETFVNSETLTGRPVTLWHQSALIHTPRDEDFGRIGTNPDEGVAITTWAGFDLKPRNFFPSTPLYP